MCAARRFTPLVARPWRRAKRLAIEAELSARGSSMWCVTFIDTTFDKREGVSFKASVRDYKGGRAVKKGRVTDYNGSACHV